jgi:hypothetical protein
VGGDGLGEGHAGADGEVADDDVDRVGAERGPDGAVPVDTAQQPAAVLSGLVEDLQPVRCPPRTTGCRKTPATASYCR